MIKLETYNPTPTVKTTIEIESHGILIEVLRNEGRLNLTHKSSVEFADTLNFHTEEIKSSFRGKNDNLVFISKHKAYIIVFVDNIDFISVLHYYSGHFMYKRHLKEVE